MISSTNRQSAMKKAALVLTVLLLGTASCVLAANYAVTGQATATVATALTVEATQDLAFPLTYPGQPSTMTITNDDSTGIFTIKGEASAKIITTFYLPEYMTGPGGDRMVITFGDTDCAIDTSAAGTPAAFGDGWNNVNPQDLSTTGLSGDVPVIGSEAPTEETRIYLGGSIYPSIVQAAGSYTADIVLVVAYAAQ
jgi:hypothetical protein